MSYDKPINSILYDIDKFSINALKQTVLGHIRKVISSKKWLKGRLKTLEIFKKNV